MTKTVLKKHCYAYPRPMVAVDVVLFRRTLKRWEVLAVRRGKPPFKGQCALPGGFVEMDEDLDAAARRELSEETGITGVRLEQIGAFGRPDRDPRGRNISIAFAGVVPMNRSDARPGDDAADALWIPAWRPPELAFDHHDILATARRWLRAAFRQGKRV